MTFLPGPRSHKMTALGQPDGTRKREGLPLQIHKPRALPPACSFTSPLLCQSKRVTLHSRRLRTSGRHRQQGRVRTSAEGEILDEQRGVFAVIKTSRGTPSSWRESESGGVGLGCGSAALKGIVGGRGETRDTGGECELEGRRAESREAWLGSVHRRRMWTKEGGARRGRKSESRLSCRYGTITGRCVRLRHVRICPTLNLGALDLTAQIPMLR